MEWIKLAQDRDWWRGFEHGDEPSCSSAIVLVFVATYGKKGKLSQLLFLKHVNDGCLIGS
jgi:hypothetical protein